MTFISFIGIRGIPRTIGLIQPLILLIIMCSWRIILRFLLRLILNNKFKKKNVSRALVYGCGQSGRQLVRAMEDNSEIIIKGFLDDDKDKHGFFIHGKQIYSPRNCKR